MAEEVKIIFEIEGIQKSVSSVEELQAALKGVETQSKKTEKTVDDVAEAATKVGKNSEEAAKNAEGATKIVDEAFGGLGTKVKEVGGGMLQLGKSAVTSFKSAVMGANAMGKALIATGIGAIGTADINTTVASITLSNTTSNNIYIKLICYLLCVRDGKLLCPYLILFSHFKIPLLVK
jgi:hypothetical protein